MMKILRNKTRRYIMKNPHIDALIFAVVGIGLMYASQIICGKIYIGQPHPPETTHVEYWFAPTLIWVTSFTIFAIVYFLFTNGGKDE